MEAIGVDISDGLRYNRHAMLRHSSLQDFVVYGPVQSRRLGSSLGINILPLSYKLCPSCRTAIPGFWSRGAGQDG